MVSSTILNDLALQQIADYFQTFSEQTRIKLLFALRSGEKNVTELTEFSGCSQANVSKHMGYLTKAGVVLREKRGTSVYYRVADGDIFKLCDLVSDKIADILAAQHKLHAVMRKVSARGKQMVKSSQKNRD